MSADGKIGFVTRTQARISSEEDMRRVHRLRAANDAIVVGIGTVIADDPKLTVKGEYARGKNPIRVVLDSKGRTLKGSHVLDGKAPTIIFTNSGCTRQFGGAEVVRCGGGRVDLAEMLDVLSEKGVRKVLVEGGEAVIWSFLREGLVDDLRIFIGSLVLGGKGGPTPAGGPGVTRIEDAIPLKLVGTKRLGGGVLLEYSVLPTKE
jgi:2,5-diamino-6-(ribosylamino)-4(3H)-pyrimidinone 5'-phosphate reductase